MDLTKVIFFRYHLIVSNGKDYGLPFFSIKDNFNILIDYLSDLITKYDKEIGSLNRNQLLSIMHLLENFEKLKDL